MVLKAMLRQFDSFSKEALLQPFHVRFEKQGETNKAERFPRAEPGNRTLKICANPVSEF